MEIKHRRQFFGLAHKNILKGIQNFMAEYTIVNALELQGVPKYWNLEK